MAGGAVTTGAAVAGGAVTGGSVVVVVEVADVDVDVLDTVGNDDETVPLTPVCVFPHPANPSATMTKSTAGAANPLRILSYPRFGVP